MPADTLLAISQRAASRGASRIHSIGDLPYHLVAPILAKVPSPAQLHEISQSSPHIIGSIDDLWLAFLKRDVPNYESKPHHPANPASWFKVYKKLKKQAEAEMREGQDKLKAALGAIKKDKELNTAQIVTRSELPKGAGGLGWKQQSRFDYVSGKTGSKGAHKMTLFEKIRKEKQDAKTNKLNKPIGVKLGMVNGVRAAPDRMVQSIVEERKRIDEDRKRGKIASVSAVRAPRAPMRATGSRAEVGYDLIADREARLRAMKNKQAVDDLSEPISPPIVGQKRTADQAGLTADGLEDLFDDDLDSDDEEEEEDDEVLRSPPARTTTRAPTKPRPEFSIIQSSPEKPPQPTSASDHQKILGHALREGTLERQRSASPGKIGSPGLKPTVKRKAPPSLFHTPNKRLLAKS